MPLASAGGKSLGRVLGKLDREGLHLYDTMNGYFRSLAHSLASSLANILVCRL